MKNEIIAGGVGALLLVLGLSRTQGSSQNQNNKVEPPFTIAVVGTALDGKPVADGSCLPDTAKAMLKGVNDAYRSKDFGDLQNLVQIKTISDAGNPLEAEKQAAQLEEDDSILAVIGHSCSATTAAATEHYAEAQIPLLLPVATSRRVGYHSKAGLLGIFRKPDSSIPPEQLEHYSNVFRLIPNDQIGQTPTIRYVVRKLTGNPDTDAAIAYRSADNKQYTEDMRSDLKTGWNVPQVDLGCPGAHCVTWNSNLKPKVLVLISTTNTARDFVQSPTFEKLASGGLQYLVLTDGARQLETFNDCKDLSSNCMTGAAALEKAANFNVQVLLTFPAKQLDKNNARDEYKPLVDLPADTQSYEEYSYAAMLLLGDCLKNLKKKNDAIDRSHLISELQQTTTYPGAAKNTFFMFDRGENVHPDYSIYTGGAADVADLRSKLCPDGSSTPPQTGRLNYLCFVGFDRVYQENTP